MQILAQKMITNVQILLDNNTIIRLVVEPDKKITAAYQQMRNIPRTLTDNYGHWIEILDLSHNNLRDVSVLSSAPNLHTLILDHNLITSTTDFPRMLRLRMLWLNYNLISDMSLFIPKLARSCPNLQHLSLMGNTAASSSILGVSDKEQDEYRQFVIGHFQHLRHLDDKAVTSIERLRCEKPETTYVDDLLAFVQNIKESIVLRLGRKPNYVV